MNKPEFRIIGGASPEEKEKTKKEIEKALFEHFESLSPEEKELLQRLEYPKTEKEISLIKFANEETSKMMAEAGLEPYNVPPENFHLIPPDLYKIFIGERRTVGETLVTKQGIVLDAQYCRHNPVFFGAVILHELIHLKGHLTLEVQEEFQEEEKIEEEKEGKKIKKTTFRKGFVVEASQQKRKEKKPHGHFVGLNEAIVSQATKILFKKMLQLPELKNEKEWLDSPEVNELKEKLVKEKGIKKDDIIWVGKKEQADWEIFPYFEQREVLNYVCQEIQKEFPEKFKEPDDVFNLFLRAHFTGRLLEIGKLVEKTFGKGSFRILGNMDIDRQSGINHLETLKRLRLIKLKNKNK